MDEILVALVAMAVGAAVILAIPISLALVWSRTRDLRARIDALQNDLRTLQHEVRQVREVPEVRQVREVRGVPEVREVPEVPEVREVPAAPPAPAIAPAPPAPPAPLAPLAPPAPLAPLAPEAPRAAAPASLETIIGARWLLYIGVVAIVIGVAYFEKLAMDRGWITPAARLIQGAVVGLVLMFAGTRFVKRGYEVYGQIIMGGGGAILYLSTFAAFNFYDLIGRATAFALMVGITVLIAWLADRERSQGLALFAVGGGFATPFMLPGGTDTQISLFTYAAILIAGTAALSRRRDWPALNLLSYGFTLLTVAVWAFRFYSPEKYLRTELYLTGFCAMFLYILWECRRKDSDAARVAVFFLWTAPIAYYIASLAILVPHDSALLVWLVALMLAGGVTASIAGAGAGLLASLAAGTPLILWCATSAAQGMRQEGMIAIAAIYVIALLAQLEGTILRDHPRDIDAADIFWVHGNALGMFAAAYLLTSSESLVNAGYLAAAFAVWQGVVAAIVWQRRTALAIHYAAVGFTLAAIAIALIFSGTAITAGWAVEGAVMIALALRQRMTWLRVAGQILFAIAVLQTIEILATPAPVLHVVFFNPRAACAALVIALCYALAWLDWRDPEIPNRELGMGLSLLTAQFVTLALLTSEINAYWAVRNGYLERQLSLSITWGVYATVLVVIGLIRQYAPIRYFAIAVLAVTIAKVFFVDMAELDRIYRVGSIIVLGVLLLVTSYLYTRYQKAIDDPIGR